MRKSRGIGEGKVSDAFGGLMCCGDLLFISLGSCVDRD
jgi:hypothetical protein